MAAATTVRWVRGTWADALRVQKVSASDGPMPEPIISRRPSVFTATAIVSAMPTMRASWRTFR